jgi:hypothetical protein
MANPALNSQARSVYTGESGAQIALLAEQQEALDALAGQGWQGTWSPTVSYFTGALVDFNGVIYLALGSNPTPNAVPNLNNEPDTSPTFWQATGKASFAGAWSSTTTYTQGQIVDASGVFYISLTNGNLNNPPAGSPTDWAPISTSASVFVGIWNSGTAYVLGNQVTYSGTKGNGYYIALVDNTNKQPDTNPSDWQQIGAPNSYVFLGAYNGATAYVPGNQVSYIGSYWINISASTGNAPGVGSSFWEQVGQAAILLQNWSSSIAYTLGMEVVFNGDIYQCILANTNETPPNSTYWYLEGSANSQTQGKNALFNPGFESNLGGYVINSGANATLAGEYVADGWDVGQLDNPAIQATYLANFANHGGNQNLGIRIIAASASLPSDNTYRSCKVLSAPIPVSAGDVFVLSGWVEFELDGGITVPGGALTIARLDYQVFSANGTMLAEIVPFDDVTSAQGYTQLSVQQTIAATYGGVPPSYIRVGCNGFVLNNSGSTWTTSGTQFIDAHFDDLSVVFSTNPASGEVLAVGSTPNTTGTGFTYTSTTTSITINWSGLTLFRADNTTTAIPNGSQTITGLTANTTYYFYPTWVEATQTLEFIDAAEVPSLVAVTGVLFTASTSGYVSTTNSVTPNTSSVSIEFWTKFTSAGTACLVEHCNVQTGTPTQTNVFVGVTGGQVRVALHGSGGLTPFVVASGTQNDGNWHHVVVTFSGTTATIYIDGVSSISGSVATASYVAGYWRVSSDQGGGNDNVANATVADVAIYNGTVLTSTQVIADYNAMNAGSQSAYQGTVSGNSPTYFWHLTETIGTTAVDSAGSNTGTYQATHTLAQSSNIAPATGSPAIAWMTKLYPVAQAQAAQGNVPLSAGAMALATPAGGSGGGSGGGAGGGKQVL